MSACNYLTAFCALFATTFASAADAPSVTPASWHSHARSFICAGNVQLTVTYLDIADGNAFAFIHYNDKPVLLRQQSTTSNTRYIAVDEQNSYRWYIKDGQGMLSFLAADHTASEQVLLRGCITKQH